MPAPGRPRLPKHLKKSRLAYARVTEPEFSALTKLAKSKGLTLCDWIRGKLLPHVNGAKK